MTCFRMKFIRTLLFFYFMSYSYTIDHAVLNSFYGLCSYTGIQIVSV